MKFLRKDVEAEDQRLLPAMLVNICAINALALVSLHANYLGIVRAATRKGHLSDNVVIVGATQAAARTFNILMAEGRQVIVALIPESA